MSEGPEGSAQAALEFVADGQTLGLGTGRAATAFVRALGERVREGLQVRGVPTSEATAAVARAPWFRVLAGLWRWKDHITLGEGRGGLLWLLLLWRGASRVSVPSGPPPGGRDPDAGRIR